MAAARISTSYSPSVHLIRPWQSFFLRYASSSSAPTITPTATPPEPTLNPPDSGLAQSSQSTSSSTPKRAAPTSSFTSFILQAKQRQIEKEKEQRKIKAGIRKYQLWQLKRTMRGRRFRKTSLNLLENTGSTQNRHNTFRAHDTSTFPYDSNNLTLSHLVASNLHLGHSITSSNPASYPYIYGVRHNTQTILDVRKTLVDLRRAAMVVRDIVERDGTVIFYSGSSTYRGIDQDRRIQAVTKAAGRLGRSGFALHKWTPGTLTNPNRILGPGSLFENYHSSRANVGTHTRKAQIEKQAALEKNDDVLYEAPPRYALANVPRLKAKFKRTLTTYDLKPSLIVMLGPVRLNSNVIREATQNGVPTMGLIDSDGDARAVTWPITGNAESGRGIEVIAGVLSSAGAEGRARRIARRRAYYEAHPNESPLEEDDGSRYAVKEKEGSTEVVANDEDFLAQIYKDFESGNSALPSEEEDEDDEDDLEDDDDD